MHVTLITKCLYMQEISWIVLLQKKFTKIIGTCKATWVGLIGYNISLIEATQGPAN